MDTAELGVQEPVRVLVIDGGPDVRQVERVAHGDVIGKPSGHELTGDPGPRLQISIPVDIANQADVRRKSGYRRATVEQLGEHSIDLRDGSWNRPRIALVIRDDRVVRRFV